MPFYLKAEDDISEVAKFKTVLIIPCRFCPAASMAVRRNEPYIEFFNRFLKTASYEQHIKTVKSNLEIKGVKTSVFRSKSLHQFVLCMWTSKRREKLLQRANKYEALLVMGCEAAVQIVHDTVKTTSCQVLQGMKSEGIMCVKPRFHLPCNISLELDSITPFYHQPKNSKESLL